MFTVDPEGWTLARVQCLWCKLRWNAVVEPGGGTEVLTRLECACCGHADSRLVSR